MAQVLEDPTTGEMFHPTCADDAQRMNLLDVEDAVCAECGKTIEDTNDDEDNQILEDPEDEKEDK